MTVRSPKTQSLEPVQAHDVPLTGSRKIKKAQCAPSTAEFSQSIFELGACQPVTVCEALGVAIPIGQLAVEVCARRTRVSLRIVAPVAQKATVTDKSNEKAGKDLGRIGTTA